MRTTLLAVLAAAIGALAGAFGGIASLRNASTLSLQELVIRDDAGRERIRMSADGSVRILDTEGNLRVHIDPGVEATRLRLTDSGGVCSATMMVIESRKPTPIEERPGVNADAGYAEHIIEQGLHGGRTASASFSVDYSTDANLSFSASDRRSTMRLSQPSGIIEVGDGTSRPAAGAFGVTVMRSGGSGGATMGVSEQYPAIRVFDENGNYRAVLGSITLTDITGETKTSLAPSTLTLLDADGEILYRLPK